MKNTDMLEWMNGLDVKYLNETAQPVIHHAGKRRMMPALIAAAAAVMCLTASVGAYMTYNRQMVQFGFGTLGEARMAELVAPEPATYDNGKVAVTVENVLSDGIQAMLLLTLEPVDKSQPFDWTVFDENQYDAMRNRFLIGGKEYRSHIATAVPSEGFSEESTDAAYEIMTAAGQRWIKMYFTLPEDASDETLAGSALEFFLDVVEANGQRYVNGEMLAGISIPLDLRQNVDAVQMRSEDGQEMTLSPFELYMIGHKPQHNDWWRLEITWKNGETQRIQHGDFAGSSQTAGKPVVTWGEFAVPTHEVLDSESVVPQLHIDGPEDWCGFIDVNEVAAFRFGDRIFYPVA